MPEGPEVEKLAAAMQPWVGQSITRLQQFGDVPIERFFPNGLPDTPARAGKTIAKVEPFGKYIWVETGEYGIAIHLNSTGWLTPVDGLSHPLTENFIHTISPSNIRFSVSLERGPWYYHDPRTWGRWTITDAGPDGLTKPEFITNKGPDWLKNPEGAWAATLAKGTKSNLQLKDLLTDQNTAAGIGNYLACEACWLARLHPHQRSAELTAGQWSGLRNGIERSINLSRKNDNHHHWAVFKRAGKKCPRCHAGIGYVKDHGGKRGSYFCPVCQPIIASKGESSV